MSDPTARNEARTATPASEPKPDRYIGNFLLPLCILIIALICFYQTLEFPGAGEDVGPAGVPYLWIGFTTLFSIILMLQSVLHKLKPDPIPGNIRFVFLFACGLAIYLFAIENLGYYASTFLFIVSSMYALGYRRYAIMTAVALFWLVFSYFVFGQLLYIPLPEGPLIQLLVG